MQALCTKKMVAPRSAPSRGLGLAQVMVRVWPESWSGSWPEPGLDPGLGLAQIAAQVVAPIWAESWPGSGPCLAPAGHGWPNALFKAPGYTEMIRDHFQTLVM